MCPGDGRRLSMLVLCLLLVLGACTAVGGPGSPACASPELSVTPTKTAPGGRMIISGTASRTAATTCSATVAASTRPPSR